MADPHATLDPWEAKQRGCTCEFGCRNCGYDLAGMGNCAAWNPCPVGRDPSDDCPLIANGEHG